MINKGDPLCDLVRLVESNGNYAVRRHKNGKESTVSTSDLAPCPGPERAVDASPPPLAQTERYADCRSPIPSQGERVAQWAVTLASAPMVVGSIPALRARDFWVPPCYASVFRSLHCGFPPSSLYSETLVSVLHCTSVAFTV